MAPRVVYLGMGSIGRGMSKNLAQKGPLDPPLIIWNRNGQRAQDHAASLPQGKVKAVSSLDEAVDAGDIIFLCMTDDAAVTAVLSKAFERSVQGKLFVDCSTLHPDTSNQLAQQAEKHGAFYVASPVFGVAPLAEAGMLISVLAGPASQVDKVKPLAQGVTSRGIIDFSDQPAGSATTLKIIGNTMVMNMIEATAEAHVLADATGIDSRHVHSFIDAVFGMPVTIYSTGMMSGSYHKQDKALMAATTGQKDVRHALNLAHRHGAQLPALEVVLKHLIKVAQGRGGGGGLGAIYGVVREEAGLPYENEPQP